MYYLIFYILFIAVATQDVQKKKNGSRKVNVGRTKISDLLQRQRTCFDNSFSCKLIMNERKAVGCSQCGFSSGSAILKQYLQSDKLLEELRQKREEDIVILVSETLIFKRNALQNILASSDNLLAIIVAEQRQFIVPDSGVSSSDTSPNQDVDFPYPPMGQFSGDEKIPNLDYMYKGATSRPDHPDNPFATAIQFLNVPVNVFYVREEDANILRGLLKRLNSKGQGQWPTAPLLKIESKGQAAACPAVTLQAQETAAATPKPEGRPKPETNSAECISTGTCRPIGGYSAWSALNYINETSANGKRQIVAVTAPMDSTAFFHDLASGAAAEIASVASLMAIVQAVGDYSRKHNRQPIQQPMYFAFNAQSWGFAGSSRFLEDVSNFKCNEPDIDLGRCTKPYAPNLKFKALNGSNFMVINLGGLVSLTPKSPDTEASLNDKKAFFIHGISKNNSNSSGDGVEKALNDQFKKYDLLDLKKGFRNGSFMDASQSFQLYQPDADVVTLTNFKKNFSNQYYHSIYDNASEFEDRRQRKPLYDVTAVVANTVIQLCFNDPNAKVEVNSSLIDEFIDCLTTNWVERNCSLAQEYLGDDEYSKIYKNVARSNYAGVFVPPAFANTFNPSGYAKTRFLQHFMAHHNRIDPLVNVSSVDLKCTNDSICIENLQKLENKNTTNAEFFRHALCVKGVCVIAESHLHAAFGTGLVSINDARSDFTVITPLPSPEAQQGSNPTPMQASETPLKPAWTESNQVSKQFCYLIDDTLAFEGMVLGSGLAVFVGSLLTAWYINPKRVVDIGLNNGEDEATEVDLLGVAEVR